MLLLVQEAMKEMAKNSPGQFWLGIACATTGLAGYILRQVRRQVGTKIGTATMFGLILVGAYLMGATEIFTDVVDKIIAAVRGS